MRGRFEGLGRVIRFNWTYYASCVAVIMLLAFLSRELPLILGWAAMAGAALAAFWCLASLVVTHWVYDRSALYRLEWLEELELGGDPRVVALSAGFDEISGDLERCLPHGEFHRFDFYDAGRDTEASIARARREGSARDFRPVAIDALPLADGAADLVVAFECLHEIRDEAARGCFLAEIRRTLGAEARLVVVEHLRDVPNLLAYGPGAFHFLPRRAWLRGFEAGGLELVEETSITPFIRVFVARARRPRADDGGHTLS